MNSVSLSPSASCPLASLSWVITLTYAVLSPTKVRVRAPAIPSTPNWLPQNNMSGLRLQSLRQILGSIHGLATHQMITVGWATFECSLKRTHGHQDTCRHVRLTRLEWYAKNDLVLQRFCTVDIGNIITLKVTMTDCWVRTWSSANP